MTLHPPDAGKPIFLTGGNGVVGRALVRELGTGRIVFLQHSSRIEHRGARSVVGDITKPRLGLSRSKYDTLRKTVGMVVHCAAITNLQGAMDITRATNVEGTRNIVALAEHAGVPLVHVSTAFVSDRVMGCGIEGRSTYRDSKAMAEELVRNAGIPHTILRPSIVVGDAADGAISEFQGFHTMVACFLRGVVPMIPATESSICDFVPRDLVARAIAAVIRERAFGKEYWITAGSRALPLLRMTEMVAAFATRRGRPVAAPRAIDPDSVVRLFLPVFMPSLPQRARLRIEQLLDYARYFDVHEPFPCSLPDMQRRGWLEAPDSYEDVFERNMAFWADSTGFGTRHSRQARAPEAGLMQRA